WSAYFPAGIGIMIALSPVFLESYGWRNMWYANAVLVGVFLVVFAAMTRGDAGVDQAAERQTLRDVAITLVRPGPWLLALSFMMLSIGTFSLMTWLPTFLIESLGHSPTAAALYTSIFAILFIPPNVISGWVLKWPAVKRWYLVAIGAVGLGVLPMGIMGDGLSETVRILCAIGFTQTAGLIPGAVFAGVPVHAPSEKQVGAVTGVLLQGNSLGVLAGPPLIAALVVSLGGWAHASWVMLIVGGIAMAAAFGIRRVEDTARVPSN
ncbi:MAG: MFS transporter, partial [Proteobacteria bacterium]|nr:MFS transporter [Pseudomonadota bacterium]